MIRPHDSKVEMQIKETVNNSIKSFYEAEKNKTLSYRSFLYSQFVILKKRWWIIQFILLLLLYIIISLTGDSIEYQHSMSIISTLFAIFIIPEFWKDKYCHTAELEQSSFYSLRDIYCARLLLFGFVDISILTIFNICLVLSFNIDVTSVILNFYIPMIITISICFFTLCKPQIKNPKITVLVAILLCIIWWFVTLNKNIYSFLQTKLWIILFVIGIILLIMSIYRLIKDANKI